jgi:hypothetical protein
LLDTGQQLLVGLVRFLAVSHERVLLPVGPQPDALTQVTQISEVAYPQAVHGLQHQLSIAEETVRVDKRLLDQLLHPVRELVERLG